nr:hypothetical protein [Tanacetum cinerariifolium]
TAESPKYVAESDLKEDPEEYEDEETKDGPADYPMDGGDDGDDDDGERLARCTASAACPSPPPVSSPLLLSSGCPTQIQTLRLASTQALINAVTVIIPSPLLP